MLQALGACLVRAEGGSCGRPSEARVGSARVGSAGLEDVGVGTCHDVGHHGAGGGPHDIDAVTVTVVLGQGVVHHADDSEGVAALSVGQARGVLHVPTIGLVGGSRVDEDEAVRVGVRRETSSAEPLLGGPAARVELEMLV